MIQSWFLIFIYFAAGLVIAHYQWWFLLVISAFLAGLSKLYLNRYFAQILLAFIVASTAIFYSFLTIQVPPIKNPSSDYYQYTGTVKNLPQYDGRRGKFVLKTDNTSSEEKNIQVFTNFNPGLKKGDRIKVRGSLQLPSEPGNPGEFDYRTYLAYSGIYYVLTAEQPEDLQIISSGRGLKAWLNSYRFQGENLFYQTLTDEEAAIMLGMILGKKEGMDQLQYQDFQKTGIVHLFAVSGLHVGFLLLLIAWISTTVGLSRSARFYSSTILLLLYGTMVGWPVSVQRASIMAFLALLALYMGRNNQLLNSLGIAGLVILLLDPLALYKISFQLSFLATWGLIYLFPLCKNRFASTSRLVDLALIPLCAQLPVIPLIAYHFNLFTPVALLANIAVTYIAGAVVMLGFLALFFSGILPWLSLLFLYPAGLIIEIILFLTETFLNLPGAYIWVATPAVILVILYYIGLLLVFTPEEKSKHPNKAVGGILMALFLIIILLPAGLFNRGTLEVVFLDVGQGDCILLKSPGGKFVLVDGGGSDFYDVADRKVLPYLHHRGIRQISAALNTHPDTDHLKGLMSVVGEMPVSYIGIPHSLAESERYRQLKTLAAQENIPILSLRQGTELNIEKGFRVKVLYPRADQPGSKEVNDHSLVLRIDYGFFSLLLTGDSGAEVLEELIRDFPEISVTIVKVPHHGSKSSLLPEFYTTVKPEWAVISVGGNPFGHPHPSVLEELNRCQIKVLRTDLNGAIHIYTDGKVVKVSPFRSGISIRR